MSGLSIFWFRRDLRLDDNASLYYALINGEQVQPIFIFDPKILNKLEDRKDRRVSFILQALNNLESELNSYGATLWVFYGEPSSVFSELAQNHRVKRVFFNRDYEPYANERDVSISTLLNSLGIATYSFKDHVIFEPSEIVKPDGSPYLVFTPFSNKWKSSVSENDLNSYSISDCSNSFHHTAIRHLVTHDEIGFEKHPIDWNDSAINLSVIGNYHRYRDFPALQGTAKLSAHLRFGTISIRHLARIAISTNEKFLNELIWREFYQTILFHFPHVVKGCFKPNFDRIMWPNNEDYFEAWKNGQTGYPIVDAGMRELNSTGFMHNRVRMIVASFLVKDLLIDWRLGEAYFAAKLLDFELASNNGGWQWAAGCGADAAPFFRIFNPELQKLKFDPNNDYIKKWIPEFGTSAYPKPIVDHKKMKEKTLKLYAERLKV